MPLWTLLVFAASVVISIQQTAFEYKSNNDLDFYLRKLVNMSSNISKFEVIGKSEKGFNLHVVEITSNIKQPNQNTDELLPNLKPSVKLIGNIHGHETGGRTILLNLIEYLLGNYASDERVKNLIDTTRIFILCSINPDGYNKRKTMETIKNTINSIHIEENYGHKNDKEVDIELDFDWRNDRSKNQVSETISLIRWMRTVPFVTSASFYAGKFVVAYPLFFDNKYGFVNHNAPTEDDEIFRHLASTYANNHPNMSQNSTCNEKISEIFSNGIINGAMWYPLRGTMADYNYRRKNCLEINVYLGCEKWLKESNLKKHWDDNKEALLAFIEAVHMGVKGVISDNNSVPIPNAALKLVDGEEEKQYFSAEHGEYWRLLFPGTYIMEVSARGYKTEYISFNVKEGLVTIENVKLDPSASGSGEKTWPSICCLLMALFLVFTV